MTGGWCCHHSAAPDVPCEAHPALPFGRYSAPTLEVVEHIRNAAREDRITPEDLFDLGQELTACAKSKMGGYKMILKENIFFTKENLERITHDKGLQAIITVEEADAINVIRNFLERLESMGYGADDLP